MNPILNPQEFIPDVQSKYTVIKDEIQPIDLNEDSWSMDYFVIFFHTGPRDPIATELLHLLDKHNNPGVSEFPCKIVAISMDSPQAIYDWVQEFPDFDVPMMSDKENAIGEQFGVMMEWSPGLDHPGPGYCANAAFIVDRFDKVRYHSVLDARCVHDLDELARVVKALRATDEGMLAMVDWKDDSNSVENSKKAILKWQEDYYESYKAKHTMMGKMKGTIEAGKKKGWFGWWGGKSSDDEQQEDEREGSQEEETDESPQEDEEGAPEKEMEDYNAPITDYATLETENHNWKYNFGRLCIAEEFPIDEEGDYNEEEEDSVVAEDEQTEDEQKYSEDEEDHNEETSVEEEESRADDEEVAEQTVAKNKADEKTATKNKTEPKAGQRQADSEKQKQPPVRKQGSATTTKSGNPSGTKNTSSARTPPRNRNQSGSRNPPRTRNPSGARSPSRAKAISANRNAAGARNPPRTKTPTSTRNQSGTRTPSRARATHASRNASRGRTPPRTQTTARNSSGARAAPKSRNQSGPRAAQRANTTSGNRNPAKSRNPSGKPQKAVNKKKR